MKEALEKIINFYGIYHQQRKFQEEVFELQEAITTHELKKSVEYEIPLTEIIGTKEHIAEELADVLVMLEQFRLYYDISLDDVKKIGKSKIDRQLKRIEEEQTKINK